MKKTIMAVLCATVAGSAAFAQETQTAQQTVTRANEATVNTESSNVNAPSSTAVNATTSQVTGTGTVTAPATGGTVSTTVPGAAANVTVTAPGRSSGVATTTSADGVTYEQRAEAAYRAANVPQDVIVKLRDYDVKIRDARVANDAALVRKYYSEQATLLTPQQINGVTTYLRANPVAQTTAVTVWEDPAYVSVASPATVTNPTTLVTKEVRTQPVVTRQVQVPVVQGSVPVVVRDPVPVVRTEVSAPATVSVEVTPAPVVTTTEEVTTYTRTKIDSETKEK